MAREDETQAIKQCYKEVDKLKFEYGYEWFYEDKEISTSLMKLFMIGFLDRKFNEDRKSRGKVMYRVKGNF